MSWQDIEDAQDFIEGNEGTLETSYERTTESAMQAALDFMREEPSIEFSTGSNYVLERNDDRINVYVKVGSVAATS